MQQDGVYVAVFYQGNNMFPFPGWVFQAKRIDFEPRIGVASEARIPFAIMKRTLKVNAHASVKSVMRSKRARSSI